ncbi:MAG TPA: glycoside hydrolase family 38 C-terminal domain-containing protein [Terracidiphilus sp.]|jgi:alpha-mannosidase
MKNVSGIGGNKRAVGISLLSAALCVSAGLIDGRKAQAQSAEQAAQIVKSLHGNSQAVVGRLSELDSLPADEWRFHAGDLAHGESTDLDDSSWQTVKGPTRGSQDAEWFRRWVEVPQSLHGYDLTGTRIWFSFSVDANGPIPEIIYFNGRRVALGDDLEPIVLFDKAKPGDKVLVTVKLLHTVDQKTFVRAGLKIDFAENRPNPEDLRLEILSAALLIPSLSKNIESDTATLEKAADAVDLGALDAKDQAKFDASLKQAQSTLEALKPVLQQATMHLTGNSHIDAAWLWPWTETVDVVKRTFGTALQLMNEYPDYTYTQSAAQYNAWIADKYPQMNDEIKQRIKEGRWEIVGGMWVEPDLNMPDGEAQVRSILVGKRWFQKEYGVDVRIGWNPDSFGYTWQLPQIYKRSGIDYFVTQKMTWNDTNQLPFKLFWWESPDGSKVLTYFPHDYANDNLNPVRLAADMAQARERAPGMTEMMDLYGIGDHGGGPTRAILDEGVHWMQPDKVVPKSNFGTAQSYFISVEGKIAPDSPVWDYESIAKGYKPPPTPAAGQIAIPTWNTEMYLEYHRGVMTTQANHKRNMRDSEEQALNAEKFASLAWLEGKPYPGDELTEAWKKITFNDFHDLAAGSGIGIIYKDAQKDFDQVRWATNEISQRSVKTLSASIDTQVASGVPVLVLNPLAWERSGPVTTDVQLPAAAAGGVSVLDPANHVVPSQILKSDSKTNSYKLLILAVNVPSLGYKVLHVVSGTKPFASDLKADGLTLENSALKVVVDNQTGCITSLYDKKTKFEALAPGACGNQLQTFKDLPKDYDAWNIDPGTLDHFTSIDKADSVELVEKGPLRGVIRVTHTWQSSKFVQDITLNAFANQVDVVNDIDWHETHVLLKAAFPLAATSNKATYEVPYGSIQRATTRNNSWEQAQFEVPALRWADLGDGQHGFSLLNNSKYGYDDKDNMLRISLLRSPTSPDPDADRGHHHFTYALYPHGGDWKQALTVRHGYEYNYPLYATQVQAHTGSLPAQFAYVTVKPENVVLTALKKAEDSNGLIFRVYEWAGKSSDVEFHVPKGATGATLTNLMEKPEGETLKIVDDTVTAPIHPYEILTVRVDYPANQ